MTDKRTDQPLTAAQKNTPTEIDNLIKNGDFYAGSDDWTIADGGDPDNCVLGNGTAQLKSNGNISQTVEIERAAPYTLRFMGLSMNGGAGVAQVIEHGIVTQTYLLSADGGRFVKQFVTRENTSVANVRFTGTQEGRLIIQNVILTKDIPDPEELVKNSDFDFDRESWTVKGGALFDSGTCTLLDQRDPVSQRIDGLSVGATYRIVCKTVAHPDFFVGFVHLRPDTAEQLLVATLERDTHEYSYEYQATSDNFTIGLTGTRATFDSVSVKRISVA